MLQRFSRTCACLRAVTTISFASCGRSLLSHKDTNGCRKKSTYSAKWKSRSRSARQLKYSRHLNLPRYLGTLHRKLGLALHWPPSPDCVRLKFCGLIGQTLSGGQALSKLRRTRPRLLRGASCRLLTISP